MSFWHKVILLGFGVLVIAWIGIFIAMKRAKFENEQ